MRSLSVSAPAKINLFLGVGGVRSDGYHAVTTVLHTTGLADSVVLTPSDALTLVCDTDLGVPPERNLAYRAAAEFSRFFDIDVLIDISVVKRIPSAAGLGGGSADAAAVLAGLAYWGQLPLTDSRLLQVARSLGADVPFFLYGGAALMGGRGDELLGTLAPVELPVVIVRPDVSISTAAAYAAFDAHPEPVSDVASVVGAMESGDPAVLGAALFNNMTPASVSLAPEIGEVLEWLRASEGVLGVAMAGSGSATFAICDSPSAAQSIAMLAAEKGWWAVSTATTGRGPTVSLCGEGQ